jgi:hypothetical protein
MALMTALGGLIGGFGNSKDARTSTGSSTAASTSTPGYTPAQTSTQGSILEILNGLMKGSAGPQVQAMQTQSADQINKGYSGLGERMNRFLAARGFGKSGQAGKVQLDTELGRQGALAGNNANFAKIGLDEQNTALQDALTAAYRPASTTTTGSGNTTNVGAGSSLASALAGAFAGFDTGMNQMALYGEK